MRFNRLFAILAATVILSVLAVGILATPALAAPTISLDPLWGTAGTTVTIIGENYTSYAGDEIHIYFGNTEIAGSPLTISPNGAFSLTFPVPDSAMPGRAYVTVRDESGRPLGDSVPFDISPPSLKLSPGGGKVGTTVTVSGEGFHANQTVTFTYSGHDTIELGAAVNVSDIGECSFSFDIPESTGKEHKVIAMDEVGNKAEAIISVIPSVVLDPVSGAIGDTITATGTGFGDNSQITIRFGQNQAATNKSDANGSFEATFEAPDMELQAYDVSITDLSDNGVVASFTINAGEPSFVFPPGAIYGLMGLGGLVLFIIGVWVGRRYAYTY